MGIAIDIRLPRSENARPCENSGNKTNKQFGANDDGLSAQAVDPNARKRTITNCGKNANRPPMTS
jgi:hypothetical protein